MKGIVKRIMLILGWIMAILIVIVLGMNFYVVASTKNRIVTTQEASQIEEVDCIIVLGAGIWGDKPSHMLEDRLLEGIQLYHNKASTKMVMSGDHGKEEYDEVNIMKKFAIDKGVLSKDIFMDHAGFSTYESMYRVKEIFQAKKIIIVTQQYHLYRALYIAEQLGIEAYGVPSNPRKYAGQIFREIREIIARDKDVIKCMLKPQPTFLGESIPVSGNGDITNDKEV